MGHGDTVSLRAVLMYRIDRNQGIVATISCCSVCIAMKIELQKNGGEGAYDIYTPMDLSLFAYHVRTSPLVRILIYKPARA